METIRNDEDTLRTELQTINNPQLFQFSSVDIRTDYNKSIWFESQFRRQHDRQQIIQINNESQQRQQQYNQQPTAKSH